MNMKVVFLDCDISRILKFIPNQRINKEEYNIFIVPDKKPNTALCW